MRTDTCILCKLAFENELEYHYLYVRINSSDDHATSDINLVGFPPVPPEFMRINCILALECSSLFIYVYQVVERFCFATTCHGARHCSAEPAVR